MIEMETYPNYPTYYNSNVLWTFPSDTSVTMVGNWCEYCSSELSKVYHTGICPKIKSIEYHPNGNVKRIVFRDGAIGGG